MDFIYDNFPLWELTGDVVIVIKIFLPRIGSRIVLEKVSRLENTLRSLIQLHSKEEGHLELMDIGEYNYFCFQTDLLDFSDYLYSSNYKA